MVLRVSPIGYLSQSSQGLKKVRAKKWKSNTQKKKKITVCLCLDSWFWHTTDRYVHCMYSTEKNLIYQQKLIFQNIF